MNLRVLSGYRNEPRGLDYAAGQEVDVPDELGRYLLTDAPGCFETVTPKVKAPEAPPENKMVESAPVRKATRRKKS